MANILNPYVDLTIKKVGDKYEAYMSCGSVWDSMSVPNLNREHLRDLNDFIDKFNESAGVRDASYFLRTSLGDKDCIDVDHVINQVCDAEKAVVYTHEGVTYVLNKATQEVHVSSIGDSVTDVVISNEILGCPVVAIDSHASFSEDNPPFYRNERLESVVIPDSVVEIGESAFKDCVNLTSVTIPNSVISIGNYAFSDCTGLESIIIPDSVTSIENGAFSGCTGLASITIPDSVASIGNFAFPRCTKLKSVTIPDSVTSIGTEAFWGCTSLTGVVIPDSVTYIGDGAFEDCSNLTDVVMPNSVELGEDVFSFTPYEEVCSCGDYNVGDINVDAVISEACREAGERNDVFTYTKCPASDVSVISYNGEQVGTFEYGANGSTVYNFDNGAKTPEEFLDTIDRAAADTKNEMAKDEVVNELE